ncbi:hypothetical protein [Silvanigrella sp.]|jgi:hypothetical protein|uniref:hypothetical protein n=1 Tax=Silvanigrella sp. TaxID=2024976 RepID=UPI0037C8F197
MTDVRKCKLKSLLLYKEYYMFQIYLELKLFGTWATDWQIKINETNKNIIELIKETKITEKEYIEISSNVKELCLKD